LAVIEVVATVMACPFAVSGLEQMLELGEVDVAPLLVRRKLGRSKSSFIFKWFILPRGDSIRPTPIVY
jgi:hypothetical protein